MDIIKEDDILKRYNEILKRNKRMTIEEIIDENIKSQTARMQAELELGLRINEDNLLLVLQLLKMKTIINKCSNNSGDNN